MEIIARYKVVYVVQRDGRDFECSTECLISEGYSTFEDLRTMIGIPFGLEPAEIDLLSVVKVRETGGDTPASHDVIGFDHPVGWGQPDGLLSSAPDPAEPGTVRVEFWGDTHRHTVDTSRSDLLVIDVDGRPVVGLSLSTGAVGVWLDGDEETWTEVHVDEKLAAVEDDDAKTARIERDADRALSRREHRHDTWVHETHH